MFGEREIEGIDVLLSKEQIKKRVQELGQAISDEYKGKLNGKPLILICILKGSFVFMADLIRAIDPEIMVITQFMVVSSYEGRSTETSGSVRILLDLQEDVVGRDCIIVEDIVDTGLTISRLLIELGTRKPRSLKVCSMLHKPSRERVSVPIEFKGFTIEDEFVVGYGLDYDQTLRGLPYIGVLRFRD